MAFTTIVSLSGVVSPARPTGTDGQELMMIPITKQLKQWLIDEDHCVDDGSDSYYSHNTATLLASGELSADKLLQLSDGEMMTNSPDPHKVFSNNGGQIRVKDASEQYSEKRYTASGIVDQCFDVSMT